MIYNNAPTHGKALLFIHLFFIKHLTNFRGNTTFLKKDFWRQWQFSKIAASLVLCTQTYYCIAILFLTHTISFAQEKRYTVRPIDDHPALKGSYIRILKQSTSGALWIGTNNGLYRFDGIHTYAINTDANSFPRIAGDRITGLAEDEQQRLWVSTDQGMNIIDQKTLRLVPLSQILISDTSVLKQPICVYQGAVLDLFFTTINSIYHFDGKEVTKHYESPVKLNTNASPLLFPKTNTHYFTSAQNIIFALKDNQLKDNNYMAVFKDVTPYRLDSLNKRWLILLDKIADTVVFTVTPGYILQLQKNNKLWQYTADNPQAIRLVFKPWDAVCQFADSDPLFLKSLKQSFQLLNAIPLNNHTWALGTTRGVFLVEEKNLYFRQIPETKGKSVRGMIQDDRGHLLIGSYDGLIDYSQHNYKLYNSDEFLSIWDLLQVNKDTFWAVTETFLGLKKIIRKKNGGFSVQTPDFSEKIRFSKSMVQTANGFWTGNVKDNLFHLDLRTEQLTTSPFNKASDAPSLVKTILKSPTGQLWVGGETGIQEYQINAKGEILAQTPMSSLPPEFAKFSVSSLYEDTRHHLWIGTTTSGLYRYQPGSNAPLENWTASNGLPHNTIYSILGSNKDSLLWLGTQFGLCRMNVFKKKFYSFFAQDGLGQNEFNTAARYKSPDGTFYFGGLDGVSFFRPEWIPEPNEVYQPYLQLFITESDKQVKRFIQPSSGQTVVVQPDEVLIEVFFRSTEFFHARELTCRYKIVPFNKDWQTINLTEKLTFAGLKPDNYTLEYEIKSSTSDWSAVETVYINVLPPWYLRSWAIILELVLCLAILFAIYQKRIQEIRKEFDFRKSVTDDLHDSLGTRLYLLKMLALKIVQYDKLKSTEEKQELLHSFENQATDALQTIRNFIWAFDPRHDTLNALCEKMSYFAENYLRPIVPNVNIQIASPLPHIKITPRLKHNLLNIYQELLTNIVKHTNSQSIQIKCIIKDNNMEIILTNTHTRFHNMPPSNIENAQLGQKSIESRLHTIAATMTWNEIKDTQQDIVLKVPLR